MERLVRFLDMELYLISVRPKHLIAALKAQLYPISRGERPPILKKGG